MVEKIITSEEIQKITDAIDILQKDLEVNPNPITASLLSKKHFELEELSHEYNVFTKELTIIL